ncbi:MAG TPA: HAD-IC family P-type ATPase, partial [Nitrososphaerales archaeon]|nr:HAD-IC family P-type ATPase [Nitrososphaerales archaeon]
MSQEIGPVEGGLHEQEVQSRREKYGYNEIPVKRPSTAVRIAKPFLGPMSNMLEIIAVICWLTGNLPEAVIMVALLVFNAALVLVREGNARKAMVSLRQHLRIQSRVKRDGAWTLVPSRELLPGDMIRVRMGDIVAADAKIIDGSLDVDQSALTGESVTATKSSGDVIFTGSIADRGEATAIVVATGRNTRFGKTVELVDLAKPKLHMEATVAKVTRNLAKVSMVGIVVAAVYAFMKGIPPAVFLPMLVVLLVAAVPVAMPTMFTLNMALGASTLAKEGVLVTRLGASEDAAAMDVLCVDKTGTMTQNKLYVEKEIPFNGYTPGDVVLYGTLASSESNQDPIDQAFLKASTSASMKLDAYHRSDFIPFDVQTRMTGATIEGPEGSFIVRKGSLSSIGSACRLNNEDMIDLEKVSEMFAQHGLRAIAVAKSQPDRGLEFVGLAGVADRVREDSKAMVEHLNGHGVSVKMLTGDSLPIAKNVAQQIGLTGEIETIPDAWTKGDGALPASAIEGAAGIAEIYPDEKYALVKSLQGSGHIVGMTGDGVNDSPALKQAEVGIAVKNSMDVAKDSASAVLVTDGLAGTVALVETGRTIYERLTSWVLNLLTKKTFVIAYIIVTLLLTSYFVVSVDGVVLILLLGDFATMSMSADNVKFSMKPVSFDIPWMFKLGAFLGLASTVEGVVLTLGGIAYLGLAGDVGKIYTFGFAYLVLAGIFNLLIVRERHHF